MIFQKDFPLIESIYSETDGSLLHISLKTLNYRTTCMFIRREFSRVGKSEKSTAIFV